MVSKSSRIARPALALALALALAGCKHGGRGRAVDEEGPLAEAEDASARALIRLAEVSPEAIEPGLRRRLLRLASEQRCPCPDVQGTLAECAAEGQPASAPASRAASCLRGRFAVRAILRGLARNDKDEEIAARLLERFGPREPERVELAQAPCRGRADAPVELVVFSDFECPFCALGRQLVELLEKEAGPRLRVCFKHLPLTSLHSHALLAAQAAAAAHLQGKFWPMHDRLFDDQKALDREDLVASARAIGLDVERFKLALDSAPVRARVAGDVAEARRLQIHGTPTFLINGRQMTDPKTVPDFLDWIAEALALRGARGR